MAPPVGVASDVRIGPHASASLPPGRYGDLTIGPHAKVTVSAGTYFIREFSLGPDSELKLDTSGGTVDIYVEASASWQGTTSGDATRFVFGFLGQETVTIAGGFRGTALAPFGSLKLGPQGGHYEGTFYGRKVTVGPGVTVKKLETPFLIGEVKVDKSAVCVGELAEVSLVSGGPTAPGTTPRIMGVVGDHQFVAFSGAPGPRVVYASIVTSDGLADFVDVPITVDRCATPPGGAPPVALHFWGAQGIPNAVELSVRGYGQGGHEVTLEGPASYAWSLGDGRTATTTSPLVTHDFSAAVDPRSEYSFFTVSVTRTTSAGSATVKKVVPVWSLYAKNRKKGIIQPPSAVVLSPTGYAVTVTNHEASPLSITSARVDFLPCDPNLDVRPQPAQALAVTVPAAATTTVSLTPPGLIPRDVCILGVHLMGTSGAGAVYADAYVRFKENPLLLRRVTSPTAIAILNQASALTRDPNRFDGGELRELVASGRLAALPPAVPPGTRYANAGDECAPGEVSSPPGLECQPTADWVVEQAQIVNAFKGHIVMDHGCGSIGNLLAAANQNYSHNSVITKSRVEIRHSTASEDRTTEAIQLEQLRLDPDILKFGYPGTEGATTSRTIDEMVTEYFVTDPERNRRKLGGELVPRPTQCANDLTPVPAVVVRPPPDAPLPILQAVDSMANPGGQLFGIDSHYRFFIYSHAERAASLGASGWASGLEPTVCSSFAHLAAARTLFDGKPLKLRPSLVNDTVPGGLPDGMRVYSVNERLAGARTLHATTSNAVSAACHVPATGGGAILGGALGLFGGVQGVLLGAAAGAATCAELAANIGNQVTNCFASDACGDTGRTWENPGAGVAVSPDDILDWDVPGPTGGTYGYNEPVVFAPVAFRHRYVWVPKAGTGKLIVRVVDPENRAFPNATVIVDGVVVGSTGSTGAVELAAVSAGTHDVEAQFNPCGQQGPPPDPLPQKRPFGELGPCPMSSPPPQSGCTVRVPIECPGGFEIDGCQVYTDSSPEPVELCSCYAIPPVACIQPLQRGGRPAVLQAGQTTEVVITLCAGAGQGGAPGACTQRCASDDDCDNSLFCSNQSCVPRPRVVRITTPAILIQAAPPRARTTISPALTCDPLVNGGTVTIRSCARDGDGDEAVQFEFDATCRQDPATGALTIENQARLNRGCGTDTERLDNNLHWTVNLPPAGPSNPKSDARPGDGALVLGVGHHLARRSMHRELRQFRVQLHELSPIVVRAYVMSARRYSPAFRLIWRASIALVAFASCGPSEEQSQAERWAKGTWAIDCVAVIGAPVAAPTPLSAVPYSRVSREKYIEELTDAELGRLCDFGQCVGGNGYRYVCDQKRTRRSPLEQEDVQAPVNLPVIVGGFGATAPFARGPAVLRVVDTVVVRAEEGRLDVGTVDRTACWGDSGGPVLVVREGSLRVLGIVRGSAGAICASPASAVPIASVKSWLAEEAGVRSPRMSVSHAGHAALGCVALVALAGVLRMRRRRGRARGGEHDARCRPNG